MELGYTDKVLQFYTLRTRPVADPDLELPVKGGAFLFVYT